MTTLEILQGAKAATRALSLLSTEEKNQALLAMADALVADTDAILAANADAHYKISKKESDGRVITNVDLLDYEGRRNELARIMGGLNITDTVLKAAEELLNK